MRQALVNQTDCTENAPDLSIVYNETSVSKIRGGRYKKSITVQQPYDELTTTTAQQIKEELTVDTSRLLSQTDAFINLCKCFSGASLFAMPWAFAQSGALSGALSLLFLAFLTYNTLFWLGKCSHLHPTISKPTYADIGALAFGKFGFYLVWLATICMTVGVCGSYLIFIGSQLSDLIKVKWLKQTVVTAAIAIPMISLSLFRSYSFLVPFTILGLVSVFAAVVIVGIEAVDHIDLTDSNSNNVDFVANENVGLYPLFFGNAAFAFLIHSVILPIEQSMRDRKRHEMSSDYKNALRLSMVAVTAMLLLFSGFSYVAFGDAVCGNIMNNLNDNKWYTKAVVIALCVNVFFTYPLFLFPMTETLEIALFNIDIDDKHQSTNDWKIEIKRNILRVCLVLITGGIAVGVPDFELICGLTGALGNNVLGIILPPIMYFRLSKLNGNDDEISIFDKIVGYFTSSLGVIVLVVCSYTFIYSIANDAGSTC